MDALTLKRGNMFSVFELLPIFEEISLWYYRSWFNCWINQLAKRRATLMDIWTSLERVLYKITNSLNKQVDVIIIKTQTNCDIH